MKFSFLNFDLSLSRMFNKGFETALGAKIYENLKNFDEKYDDK